VGVSVEVLVRVSVDEGVSVKVGVSVEVLVNVSVELGVSV
jgi:hypothetical protein